VQDFEQLKSGGKIEDKSKKVANGKKENEVGLLKGNLSLVLVFTEMINSSSFKSKVVKT
jgi:hypothetical protein